MRTIGWIAIFIGVANLVAGKFLPGFSFAIVGALILIFNKEPQKEEFVSNKTINKNTEPSLDSSFYDSILEISTIEKVINTDFSCWDKNDVIETVESFKRWSSNLKCSLSEVKKIFISTYLKNFKNDDIEIAIRHFKSNESKEANLFQIKNRNTCAHYMVLWLTEYKSIQKQNEEKINNSNRKNTQLQVRNKMTARELIKHQNNEINFYYVPNTNKERMYFECGSVKQGFVSPAVVKKIETVQLDDLLYVECATENSDDWLPCIMFQSKSPLAPGTSFKKSIGADILEINSQNPEDDDLPF